jgi:cyclic pyranopterin phosphate synthase
MTMADISNKPQVFREAIATGTIKLKRKTVKLIREGKIVKGNPLHTAKIAGILAAKKTSAFIPLCHQLPLTNVKISAEILDETSVQVTTIVRTKAQTGVEMEALTATTASLLTIWDMVKQYEKNAKGQYPSTAIENIYVVKKVKATRS